MAPLSPRMMLLLFGFGPIVSMISGSLALTSSVARPSWKWVFPFAFVPVAWAVSFAIILLVSGCDILWLLQERSSEAVVFISIPLIPGVLALIICGLQSWLGPRGPETSSN
jgi:hypothetical protein